MIRFPDYSKNLQILDLHQKMGVLIIPSVPQVRFERLVVKRNTVEEENVEGKEIKRQLEEASILVNRHELESDNQNLLTYKGRKVAAYIRDQKQGGNFYRKTSTYRYHLCDCITIQSMRTSGRERRYLATQRSDGFFEVNDLSGYWNYRPKTGEVRLELCAFCRQELAYKGIYTHNFNLAEYFKAYDSEVPDTIRRVETVETMQTYTPDQDDLSREYRKAVNYKCQRCGVDCSSHPSLLHLHHIDGDPSHNIYSNLNVLCIECHSQQPFHSQVAQPKQNKEKIEFIKVLRKDQGISDFDNNHEI